MKELKPMISAQWKNRLELMKTLTKMHACGAIHNMVESILRNSKDKEQTAKNIVESLKICKTEEEVVENLYTLNK